MHLHSQCSCGAVKLEATAAPLLRGVCHCEICQAFNAAPYADICVFRGRDVSAPEEGAVSFHTYRPPPALQRGKCSACGGPAIEYFRMPLMPELVVLPSANIAEQAQLPPALLHMFYHRRVADMEDELPKYSGYWASQIGFSRHLLPALFGSS